MYKRQVRRHDKSPSPRSLSLLLSLALALSRSCSLSIYLSVYLSLTHATATVGALVADHELVLVGVEGVEDLRTHRFATTHVSSLQEGRCTKSKTRPSQKPKLQRLRFRFRFRRRLERDEIHNMRFTCLSKTKAKTNITAKAKPNP